MAERRRPARAFLTASRGPLFGILGLVGAAVTELPGQSVPATLPNIKLSRGGQVYALAQQADGRLLIGGDFFSVNGAPRRNLARINSNGSVDDTWVVDADAPVVAIVAAPQGIFVGGGFKNVNSIPRNYTAKLSYGGTVDSQWNPNPDSFVVAFASRGPDLYVGGWFRNIGGKAKGGVAKVDPETGAVSSAWVAFTNSRVFTLGMDETSLYLGGDFTEVNSTSRSAAARVNLETGAVDSGWNAICNDYVLAVTVHRGAVYLGGAFTSVSGLPRRCIARVNQAGGAVDPTWNPGANNLVYSIKAQGEDLFVAGLFFEIGGLFRNGLAKLKTVDTGAVDFSWDADADGSSVALSLEGNALFAAGIFEQLAGEPAFGLARLDMVTGESSRAFPVRVESPGLVHALAEQPDGKLVIGGEFKSADGINRSNIARLNADGTLDATWVPDADDAVYALAANETSLYAGGQFLRIGNANRRFLAKLSTAGGDAADPAWNPNPNNSVTRIVTDRDAVYASGFFSMMGSAIRNRIAKVSSTGTGTVFPWDARVSGASERVDALALDGSAVYLGGSFSTIGGQTRNNLAALDAASGSVLPWNPNPSGQVGGIAISNGSAFVGGLFNNIGAQSLRNLAKLSLLGEGDADPAWAPNPNAEVFTVAAGGNDVYAGGLFSSIGGLNRIGVAQLRASDGGVTDLDFGTNGPVANLLPRGRNVFLAGQFSRLRGVDRTGLGYVAIAHAPLITQNSEGAVILNRNALNNSEVTHFKITNVLGGTLFKSGSQAVVPGDFISVDEGQTGLTFTPSSGLQQVSAVSALAPIPEAAGSESATATLNAGQGQVLFRFARQSVDVEEGQSVVQVTIQKIGQSAADVTLFTSPGTAIFFNSTSGEGDFNPVMETLRFLPEETAKEVFVGVRQDDLVEGDESFTVTLAQPTSDSAVANPATASITILDDDIFGHRGSLMEPIVPDPLPPTLPSGLRVILDQDTPDVGGQWRLLGEPFWRSSGTLATGLAQGNYIVDFRPVSGYSAPDRVTVPITSGTTQITAAYERSGNDEGSGSITIDLTPAAVIDAARWRISGRDIWHRTGESEDGLPTGTYTIEFLNVAGFVAPSPREITVSADQKNGLTAIYLAADASQGAEPTVVDFETAHEAQSFRYNGQLETNLGFSSGFVVQKHVVLTAAHALFDDVQQSYVADGTVKWFFQRYRDRHEPVPQFPRGWYVFTSYAAARTEAGTEPGVSTPASQNADVAALFFLEDGRAQQANLPGRGGYGGYLSSNSTDNPWLISSAEKLLVGYPTANVAENDFDKLFAAGPVTDAFTHLYNRVFKSPAIKGYPGNSGGPLQVRVEEGGYFPAAVYLGGTAETRVRAIDDDTVNLINRAETSGNGGGNNTNGGIIYYSQAGTTNSTLTIGLISVDRGPRRAINAGAAWRVSSSSEFIPVGPRALSKSAGRFNVEFKDIPGFISPPNRAVEVQANCRASVPAEYVALISEVEFGGETLGIPENGRANPVRVILRRDGRIDRPLTVGFDISGTAANGVHYDQLSNEVTFATGSAVAEVLILPIDDAIFNGNRFLKLTLRASDNFIVGGTNSATVTITEDEPPPVRQPDAALKLAAQRRFIGGNTFTTDAAGQTLASRARARQPVTFQISVTNVGGVPESFTLNTSPQATPPGFRVRCFNALRNGRDITSEIAGSGFSTVTLAPGQRQLLRIEVTPVRAAIWSVFSMLVQVQSTIDPLKSDTIGLNVRRVR
jgi:hypothetical protein